MRDDRDDHGHTTFAQDLRTMVARMERRRALGLLAAAGLTHVVGCGDSENNTTGANGGGGTGANGGAGTAGSGTGTGTGGTSTGGTGGTTTNSAACEEIPPETGGPYPGDGTNGPNALQLTGIVRSDITTSIAGASGVADGVELTMTLAVVDVAAGCAPLAGYAVYLWHCDRVGAYSMYTGNAVTENYLRGVLETDANGQVTFKTIFPGCYSGRWPHMHFEVYPSLDDALNATNKVVTSQLAFPEEPCNDVYAIVGYETSLSNFAMLTLAGDGVFSDGADLQIAQMSGSIGAGLTATLSVGV